MRLKPLWAARRPPRLAWVLLALNSLLLLLPVLGFSALRLYESALIRQTESELTAQGVVIAAAYRALLLPAPAPPLFDARWQPLPPGLDLARDAVQPPLAEPQAVTQPADAAAQAAGARLMPILSESQRHTLAALRVTDVAGVVVAASNPAHLGHSLAAHAGVRAALAGRISTALHARESPESAGLASISRNSGLRVVVALPIASGDGVLGAVELLRTPANVWQVLWAKRAALAKAAGLLLLALALVTALSLRLILRPLRDLTHSARAAAGGAPFRAPPQRGLAEFEDLASSVAQMADTLQQRASYIRDFAAHVSHEFKTPLTSILASTELLREHAAMPPAQQARFVDLIAAEAQRLHRLTQRLLELARAETATAGGLCDAVPLLSSLVRRYAERGQPVQCGALPAALPIALPEEVLDLVLATLVDNAFAHASATVTVRIEAWRENDAACIAVQDDGPGISDGNAGKLFTPFFTTGRGAGHTGLGLCIARALLRAQGGDLWLASTEPARFVLRR